MLGQCVRREMVRFLGCKHMNMLDFLALKRYFKSEVAPLRKNDATSDHHRGVSTTMADANMSLPTAAGSNCSQS